MGMKIKVGLDSETDYTGVGWDFFVFCCTFGTIFDISLTKTKNNANHHEIGYLNGTTSRKILLF